MWPFKKRKKPAPRPLIGTKEMFDRIKEYEAKGYENKGEITFLGGRKAVIMATPGEYVKRKEGGDE